MNSPAYAAGLAVGIAVALIIFGIAYIFNKKGLKGKYDERQELIRGRGYKYAFFTTISLLAAYLVADVGGFIDKTPMTHSLAIFFILIVVVIVYALYAIHNDAYFGVGMDARSYKALMWVIIVMNGVSAYMQSRDGLIVDGKLVFGPCSQILFVIAFAAILISLHVRKAQLNKEDIDEES